MEKNISIDDELGRCPAAPSACVNSLVARSLLRPACPRGRSPENGLGPAGQFLSTDHSSVCRFWVWLHPAGGCPVGLFGRCCCAPSFVFGTDETEPMTQVGQCAPLLRCGKRWLCLNQGQRNKPPSSLISVLMCFSVGMDALSDMRMLINRSLTENVFLREIG